MRERKYRHACKLRAGQTIRVLSFDFNCLLSRRYTLKHSLQYKRYDLAVCLCFSLVDLEGILGARPEAVSPFDFKNYSSVKRVKHE